MLAYVTGMNILMLGWEFPPIKSGGLGTYLFHFTRELNRLGNDITFVMPFAGKEINPGFVKILQTHQTKFIRVNSGLSAYGSSLEFEACFSPCHGISGEVMAYAYDAAKAVEGKNFEVIHCHDWMTFPAGIALKKKTGKPLIVTIHSTEFDRTGQLHPNEWVLGIEKKGLMEADKILTVSKLMKKQLVEKYGVKEEKIQVVYNAIDLNCYKKKKIEKPTKERIVLFVGRLTVQKGCDYFLETAKKVLETKPNTRFVIVGTGDLMHELIQKSIDLGINNNVTFTGFEEDVSSYYSIADVFVMPSVSEPFGLTALEAMACQAPVIVSKQSGASEVLRNTLKVDFWDVNELANKIISVLTYAPLLNELRGRGYEEILGYRGWKDVALETMNAYGAVA